MMFKTKRIMLYKDLGVWLFIFVLFSCELSQIEACRGVCEGGPDKSLFFSFEPGKIALEEAEQVSVFMENIKTKERRVLSCKAFRSLSAQAPEDYCNTHSDLYPSPSFFFITFFNVQEGQYLFTLKNQEETVSEFTYTVSYDYRLCKYCNTSSFVLNNDLQPKEQE